MKKVQMLVGCCLLLLFAGTIGAYAYTNCVCAGAGVCPAAPNTCVKNGDFYSKTVDTGVSYTVCTTVGGAGKTCNNDRVAWCWATYFYTDSLCTTLAWATPSYTNPHQACQVN